MADIKSTSFKLNPYDPCIANKTVDGKQLMLVWHMDDFKISHMNLHIVTRMVGWLKCTYEHIFADGTSAIKVFLGKVYNYLGMTLDFSSSRQVSATMIPYVKEMVAHFTEHDKS